MLLAWCGVFPGPLGVGKAHQVKLSLDAPGSLPAHACGQAGVVFAEWSWGVVCFHWSVLVFVRIARFNISSCLVVQSVEVSISLNVSSSKPILSVISSMQAVARIRVRLNGWDRLR
jgi:hypothetical protein